VDFLVVWPIILVFSAIFWAMIFLNTYRHFPKMDEFQRFKLGAENATLLTVVLVGAVVLALYCLVSYGFSK